MAVMFVDKEDESFVLERKNLPADWQDRICPAGPQRDLFEEDGDDH